VVAQVAYVCAASGHLYDIFHSLFLKVIFFFEVHFSNLLVPLHTLALDLIVRNLRKCVLHRSAYVTNQNHG
jgi:hypothetical protein